MTLLDFCTSRILFSAGCHDGLSASIAQNAGFESLYLTGYGYAAARGLKDEGYLGLHGMLGVVADIQRVSKLPLVIDADDGYGGEKHAAMTVEEYCRMGVAAIHIEDQVSPKRGADTGAKRLISRSELAAKIKSALRARDAAGSTCIIGRTDALETQYGLDEAKYRIKLMSELGVDFVTVHAVSGLDYLQSAVGPDVAPVAITMGHWADRLWREEDLYDAGVQLVLYSSPAIRAQAAALTRLYGSLVDRHRGGGDEWVDTLIEPARLNEMLHG